MMTMTMKIRVDNHTSPEVIMALMQPKGPPVQHKA